MTPPDRLRYAPEPWPKNDDEDTLARVDRQPLTETAELPQRPTEDVPPTARKRKPRKPRSESALADDAYFRWGSRYPGQ